MTEDRSTTPDGPFEAYQSASTVRIGLAVLVLIILVVAGLVALRS